MSDTIYWQSLNELLLSDKVEFTPVTPAKSSNTMSLSKLTIQSADDLKKAVQYALANPKVIAKLEYDYNNGQPTKITENHLGRARQLIASEISHEMIDPSTILDARGDIPLEDFLMLCHTCASGTSSEYSIVTDERRKELISTIFKCGNFQAEISTPLRNATQHPISCTQIIFDSADSASAIDQLIMNLSDRTQSLWRIQSVYVQESLRKNIHDQLTTEKLNATNNLQGPIATVAEDQQKNAELAKRYGGKLVVNDINTICLLFDVPAKYVANCERTAFHQIPVVVNFFRTTKELIQLMRTDFDANKQNLTSIWTENIGLFYEMAAEIESDVIWSNCIGLFDNRFASKITSLNAL